MIAALAEFERDLLIERTHSGLTCAKSEGKTLGRPQSISHLQGADLRKRLASGESIAALARAFGTSRQAVMRVRFATINTCAAD